MPSFRHSCRHLPKRIPSFRPPLVQVWQKLRSKPSVILSLQHSTARQTNNNNGSTKCHKTKNDIIPFRFFFRYEIKRNSQNMSVIPADEASVVFMKSKRQRNYAKIEFSLFTMNRWFDRPSERYRPPTVTATESKLVITICCFLASAFRRR